jgi:hypothetical protein
MRAASVFVDDVLVNGNPTPVFGRAVARGRRL